MTSSNLGNDCLTRITYDTKDVAGLKKKRLKILRHTATTNRITRAKVYVILAPKELRKLQIFETYMRQSTATPSRIIYL